MESACNKTAENIHCINVLVKIKKTGEKRECYNFFERRRWLYGRMQGDGPKGKRGK